jgi:hypothetical protein
MRNLLLLVAGVAAGVTLVLSCGSDRSAGAQSASCTQWQVALVDVPKLH